METNQSSSPVSHPSPHQPLGPHNDQPATALVGGDRCGHTAAVELGQHGVTPTACESASASACERSSRPNRVGADPRRLGRPETMQSTLGCRLRNVVIGPTPDALVRRLRRRQAAGTSRPDRDAGSHDTESAPRGD